MKPFISSNSKKKITSFISYRYTQGGREFFLQKRTGDAPTNPDRTGNFDGAVEAGETSEQAIVREIQEELNYTPRPLQFFCKYESADIVRFLFIEEVGVDFESQVSVSEGGFGKFILGSDINDSDSFTKTTRNLVTDLVGTLTR